MGVNAIYRNLVNSSENLMREYQILNHTTIWNYKYRCTYPRVSENSCLGKMPPFRYRLARQKSCEVVEGHLTKDRANTYAWVYCHIEYCEFYQEKRFGIDCMGCREKRKISSVKTFLEPKLSCLDDRL
jgi:hypothetical protein